MRARFAADLRPKASGDYPSDEEIVHLLDGYEVRNMELLVSQAADVVARESVASHAASGTTITSIARIVPATDSNPRKPLYTALAAKLFRDMPEVAAAEKDHVIFYGYISDSQTEFVVTRMVSRQLVFRLLHPELSRLKAATQKIVKELSEDDGNNEQIRLSISDEIVDVYEKGHDHVIIKGRIIGPKLRARLRETLRLNYKDFMVSAAFLILFLITLFALSRVDPKDTLHAHLERFSTGFITTFFVSLFGLGTTYWSVSRNQVIAWRDI